ncbi:glycosyltransferase, partial [Halochromatium sp.]
MLDAPGSQLILLPENQGLASAQNLGIERARHLHADQILLLDQDSEPAPTMVAELLAAWAQLQAQDQAQEQDQSQPIALIAPQVIDQRR